MNVDKRSSPAVLVKRGTEKKRSKLYCRRSSASATTNSAAKSMRTASNFSRWAARLTYIYIYTVATVGN